MIPFKSIAIILFSIAWLGVSIRQWIFDYPDKSSFIFALGFFFVGIYVAYDEIKRQDVEEMKNDIQAIDKKCNDLEVKLIENDKKEE